MFKKLKEEMSRQGLSMNKLALKAEITPTDLSYAMRGKRPMFPNWKKRIANVLGVPAAELFPEDEKGGVADEQK